MMNPLYQIPPDVETRWASRENPSAAKGGACATDDGRKRAACIAPLKAGDTAILMEHKNGPGVVRRIWATINDRSPTMLRGLRLDFFWDGSATPAASVPLGDFFNHGIGQMSTFENEFFSSPEGRSFNCCIPMPFREGARITVTNETERDLRMFFYDVNFTVGDEHPDNMLYFHAYWRRENPTSLGSDYTALPLVRGRGRFLGVNFGVIADTGKYFQSWWGEGEMKFFVDGDTKHPTLCGTGTEDYIGTGWGQGRYATRFQGCTIADEEAMKYSFYRIHLPDPIWFHQEIRATIQQIGCWNPDAIKQLRDAGMQLVYGKAKVDMEEAVKSIPYGFFEREDDWSSCAWFYLDAPVNSLPALQPLDQRVANLDIAAKTDQELA